MAVVFLLLVPLFFSVTPARPHPASTRRTKVNLKGTDLESRQSSPRRITHLASPSSSARTIVHTL
jgi:hypothetical protein